MYGIPMTVESIAVVISLIEECLAIVWCPSDSRRSNSCMVFL